MVSWSDYVLFLTVLILSILIGLYFRFLRNPRKAADEYLLGRRKMEIIPIALSVTLSQFSAATILEVPADIYRYGTSFWLICISMVLFVIINNYIYLPVFCNLQITSVYEYLGKRFDRRVKRFAFSLMVLSTILYLPLVAYAPSLIYATVTGFDIHLVSCIVCAVCVLYTAVGGLKAVVWTAVVHFFFIIISLLSVISISVRSTESLKTFWNKPLEGQRLDIDFDANPLKRDSFWLLVVGYTTHMIGQVSIHQNGVQKFLAVPTLGASRWAATIFAIATSVLVTCCVFIGLGIFGRYADCDPVLNHQIKGYDTMVPFFITDVAHNVPGISGLFLAALLSAALSTMSSNLNALAAVIYVDFLKRVMKPSPEHVSIILKLIVLFCGTIGTILTLLLGYIHEGIVPLSVTLSGVATGPLLGVFTLGLLVPKANEKGGLYGMLCGFVLSALLIVPGNYYKTVGLLEYPEKPFSVNGCNSSLVDNLTQGGSVWKETYLLSTTPANTTVLGEAPMVFKISFYYYTLIGAVLTIIPGWIISCMTKKYDLPVEKRLISPICHCFVKKYIGRKNDVKYSTLEMAELQPTKVQT